MPKILRPWLTAAEKISSIQWVKGLSKIRVQGWPRKLFFNNECIFKGLSKMRVQGWPRKLFFNNECIFKGLSKMKVQGWPRKLFFNNECIFIGLSKLRVQGWPRKLSFNNECIFKGLSKMRVQGWPRKLFFNNEFHVFLKDCPKWGSNADHENRSSLMNVSVTAGSFKNALIDQLKMRKRTSIDMIIKIPACCYDHTVKVLPCGVRNTWIDPGLNIYI